MSEQIVLATWGAIVGHTLGAPMQDLTAFRRLNFYEPIPTRMAQSDALDAWLVWSRHLRSGRSAPTVSQSALSHWNYHSRETGFGMSNVRRGLGSPISGAFANASPTGSQALGRAAYWGLAFRGRPDEAGAFAYYDASLDHAGDGVWLAVAFARVIAAAEPGWDLSTLTRMLASPLPQVSLFHRCLPTVLATAGDPEGPHAVRTSLPSLLAVPDLRHAAYTAAWIVTGLLHAKGDFGNAVRHTAGCGGASDQAGLVCGVLASLIYGGPSPEWRQPLGDTYVAGHGLHAMDPAPSISHFATEVAADAQQFGAPLVAPVMAVVEPAPAEPVTPEPIAEPELASAPAPQAPAEGEEPAPIVEVAPEPQPDMPEVIDVSRMMVGEALTKLLNEEPNFSVTELDGVQVTVQYLDDPVAIPGKPIRMQTSFRCTGNEEVVCEAALSAPEGWQVATRLTSFRLLPGEMTHFPIVVQPPATALAGHESLRLRLNTYEVLLPLAASQRWHVAGPFVNHDGMGFDKRFLAEDSQKMGDRFNGRSDLPVQWEVHHFPGTVFDLEPFFKTGPGVCYLYGIVRFARPGRYRMVLACGVGAKAYVDDALVVSYHDVHEPVPDAVPPYVGEFQTAGESRILLKILRNRPVLPAVSLYFLDEEGAVAVPEQFRPMP